MTKEWTHYISHVDKDSVTITDEEYYTTYDKEPFIEKYGEDVVIEGRMFVVLGEGKIAWCMDRITKADRRKAMWYGKLMAERFSNLFKEARNEEA